MPQGAPDLPVGGSAVPGGTLISNEEPVPTSAARAFLLSARMSTKERGWMDGSPEPLASIPEPPERGMRTYTAQVHQVQGWVGAWECKEEATQG